MIGPTFRVSSLMTTVRFFFWKLNWIESERSFSFLFSESERVCSLYSFFLGFARLLNSRSIKIKNREMNEITWVCDCNSSQLKDTIFRDEIIWNKEDLLFSFLE